MTRPIRYRDDRIFKQWVVSLLLLVLLVFVTTGIRWWAGWEWPDWALVGFGMLLGVVAGYWARRIV